MKTGEAVMELSRHGFRFRLDGEAVKVRFEGKQAPDLNKVSHLMDLVRQHKDDVRYFLKSFCSRCGGCCFAQDYKGRPLCMACDWRELVKQYPALGTKH